MSYHEATTDCFHKYQTLHLRELQHLKASVIQKVDPRFRARAEAETLSDILACEDHLVAIGGSKDTAVYRGALLTKRQDHTSSAREPEKVVLKMGFGDDAMQRLLREHGFYQRLLPLQGDQVPLCHGLFQGHMDAFAEARSTSVACLLLEDCGDTCGNLLDMPWKFRFVPKVPINLHVTDHCWWQWP